MTTAHSTLHCPACGHAATPDAHFCSACGSGLLDGSRSIRARRVVVTGLGAISSLGSNAPETWDAMVAGKTGIKRDPNLDPEIYACALHGYVDDASVPSRFLEGKAARNTSRFSRFAVEAAGEALIDAGLIDGQYAPTVDLSTAGALLGNCLGGIYDDLLPAYDTFKDRGPGRVPVHLHVMFAHNLAAYTIQQRWGMGGPSSTVVTACATGAQAIGEGFHAIKHGKASVMIAGSVESTRHPFFTAGFMAMRALVTDSNEEPEKASRPFDATRAGFVLGEGAGMLVLEDLDHALARGARIYAEILGFGSSNDAYHPIAPMPNGEGAARAIRAALDDAMVTPDQVGHINAHAASTPAGDVAEAVAIHLVFGERAAEIPVTSVKGAIGHCMGASGALETVAGILSLHHQTIPPTRNFTNPDPAVNLNVVHGDSQKADFNVMTKNSFGLGGQNACLVLGRYLD